MAKADILNILYSKNKSPLEFKFDSLTCRPLNSLLYQSDIDALYKIATSLRYNANIDLKYAAIDKIMTARGFKKFGSGTNRVVYRFLEDDSFVVKIALDRVGLNDNPAEFKNQYLLQPFITKVFEVDPTGVIATFERVLPIMSKTEMINVHEDIFDMITNCIIGKYVLSDIGAKYYMNWAIRSGFGPVLLDFPYVFELDGNKLYCNKLLDNGHHCGGEIDYDEGFNELICTSCGKKYLALELAKNSDNNIIIKGENTMNIKIMKGNNVVKTIAKSNEEDFINVPATASEEVREPKVKVFKASLEAKKEQEVRKGSEFDIKIVTRKTKGKNNNKNKNQNKAKIEAKVQNLDKKNKNNTTYPKDVVKEAITKKISDEDKYKADEVMMDYKVPDFEIIHKKRLEGATMTSLHKEYVESCNEETELHYGKTKFTELYKEYVNSLDHEEEPSVEEENTNNVLKAYGLSEDDFEEPEEDDLEDDDEDYSEYEEQYKDSKSFEKVPKSKKKLDNF